MEKIPREVKFDPAEVKGLQIGLMINSDNFGSGIEAITDFLTGNGYGVNRDAVQEFIANGMSKAPFEKFKKELEAMALEN
jgi:hypothetical protein